MRLVKTFFLIIIAFKSYGQLQNTTAVKTRMNIYIISKDKKFELLPFTVKTRAFIKSIFSKKRMRVIVASKSEFAYYKVEKLLKKHDAVIGNLWFDSHGLYKNGFSSFSIGEDNFSYKNINDTLHTYFLRKLALLTDENTKVGIGSCYGGATFIHPGSATVQSGRMNGDSLMIGVGRIFYGSNIYASSGWVMMKPGIFSDKFGLAGYPLGKRYRTAFWRPVWDHMGEWHLYNAKDTVIQNINTVSLNNIGEINVRFRNYMTLTKAIKKHDTVAALISKDLNSPLPHNFIQQNTGSNTNIQALKIAGHWYFDLFITNLN